MEPKNLQDILDKTPAVELLRNSQVGAYVCPESQCAKNQRNGPCGGTREGLCEVYDSECIWSQAYERLKAYGEEESMLDGPVVVKDNALAGTSAWANAFLGRDHVGKDGAA